MSDNWLILIPEDLGDRIDPSSARKGEDLLRTLIPQAEEIEVLQTDNVRFIDCGANLSRIDCPECGQEISQEDWADAMSAAADRGFADLAWNCSVCHREVSLHDLVYDFPQGFAYFSLEAMNPNISELGQADHASLENALGCRLRAIWQHI